MPASTKTEAKAIETGIKAAVHENLPARVLPGCVTMAQAIAAYAAQVKDGRSWGNQKLYARELLAYFKAETSVAEITETMVWDYIAWSRKQKLKIWAGGSIKPGGKLPLGKTEAGCWRETDKFRSDSTINRYLDCLRKALNIISKQRNPVTGQPLLVAPPDVPKLREPDALPRPISAADLERILAAAPDHLADAIRLCVLMGFRQREVLSLTINHVDLDNKGVWLKGEETKGKRGEFVPANRMAMEILARLVKQAKERDVKHLISYRLGQKNGTWRPIRHIDTAWVNVLKKCGLKGRYKFHSTKATFVTAVAMKAPAPVAQQLARHRDFETTQRYIRIADEISRNAVEGIDFGMKSEKLLPSPTQDSHTGHGLMMSYQQTPLQTLVGTTGFEPATPSPPD